MASRCACSLHRTACCILGCHLVRFQDTKPVHSTLGVSAFAHFLIRVVLSRSQQGYRNCTCRRFELKGKLFLSALPHDTVSTPAFCSVSRFVYL